MTSRRDFLKAVTASFGAFALSLEHGTAAAADPSMIWAVRSGETLRLDISTRQGYEGMRYLLRDVRAGVMGFPHFDLCRRIAWIQAWMAVQGDVHAPVVFTSGLRTPGSNKSTEGAARDSAHLPNEEMVFFAADWRMKGAKVERLADLSKDLSRHTGTGGTGLYVSSDFVHSDVVRAPRTWRRG